MKEGEDLWKKYCSFFEKDFSEQVEYNEKKKEEYFKKWKNTKMAKKLCPKGVKKFEDIPLTDYSDYPILHEFEAEVEHLSKTVPRNKEELWWDYYKKIGRQVSPMLDGWMGNKYAFCAKTTGTTGKSKWIAHGKEFWENTINSTVALIVITCSEGYGNTKVKKGDRGLNLVAPIPYMSGYTAFASTSEFELFPPLSVTDNITDIRRKFSLSLAAIKKGEKIDYAGGIASSFHMAIRYFTEPEKLYQEYYTSMEFGLTKFILYLMWLRAKASGKKYKNIRDIMPVKGISVGGIDTKFYINILKKEFEVIPTNAYCSTELGLAMMGLPNIKEQLVPDLRGTFFEFLSKDGIVIRIDELKKNKIYGLLGTPFGSMLIRYKTGDVFRVADFRDDGLPVLDFESREHNFLDIHGYFRVSEAMTVKALSQAGLEKSDKWAIVKEIEPSEHLHVLMEKEWEYSEEEASERIVTSLKNISSDVLNYIQDFKIKKPSEIVKVTYLRKGAFMRFTMTMTKRGVPIGQIKPPKIITQEMHEIRDLLTEV